MNRLFIPLILLLTVPTFAGSPLIYSVYKPIQFTNWDSYSEIKILEFPVLGSASCSGDLNEITEPFLLTTNAGEEDFNVASVAGLTLKNEGCGQLLKGNVLKVETSDSLCTRRTFDAVLHCIRRTPFYISDESGSSRPASMPGDGPTTWALRIAPHSKDQITSGYAGIYPLLINPKSHPLRPEEPVSSPADFRLRILEYDANTAHPYIRGLFTHPAKGQFLSPQMINRVEILNPENSKYGPVYIVATGYCDGFNAVQAVLFKLAKATSDGRWTLATAIPFSAYGEIEWMKNPTPNNPRQQIIKISCDDPDANTSENTTVQIAD